MISAISGGSSPEATSASVPEIPGNALDRIYRRIHQDEDNGAEDRCVRGGGGDRHHGDRPILETRSGDGTTTGPGPASAAALRCPFVFHTIRSDELGLGPFSGSCFQLTVRGGEIVRASRTWETREFSPQVLEPFATWVSKRYPQDAAVMYTGSGVRLTEELVRVWEKRSREYVDRRASGQERSSTRLSHASRQYG